MANRMEYNDGRTMFKDSTGENIAAAIIPLKLKEFRGKYLLNVFNLDPHISEPFVLHTCNSYEEAKSLLLKHFPNMIEED